MIRIRFPGDISERRGLRSTDLLSEVIEQFDSRFQASAGLRVDSASILITSAWIDERSGIPGALAAVLEWFVDAERPRRLCRTQRLHARDAAGLRGAA